MASQNTKIYEYIIISGIGNQLKALDIDDSESITYAMELLFVPEILKCIPQTAKPPPILEKFLQPYECIRLHAQPQEPAYHEFVLTGETGDQLYGFAVTAYPRFSNETYLALRELFKSQGRDKGIPDTLHSARTLSVITKFPYHKTFMEILKKFIGNLKEGWKFNQKLALNFASLLEKVDIPKPHLIPKPLTWKKIHFGSFPSLPKEKDLPLADVDFRLLFSTLSLENIVLIWTSLLLEKKLLFISRSLEYLTPCIHALQHLIYPFNWPYPFIPILPLSFTEVFESPVPYLIGCLSSVLEIEFPQNDEIIIDLDSNHIISKEPILSLPNRIHQKLLKGLLAYCNLFKKPRKSLRISPLTGVESIGIIKKTHAYELTSFSSSYEEEEEDHEETSEDLDGDGNEKENINENESEEEKQKEKGKEKEKEKRKSKIFNKIRVSRFRRKNSQSSLESEKKKNKNKENSENNSSNTPQKKRKNTFPKFKKKSNNNQKEPNNSSGNKNNDENENENGNGNGKVNVNVDGNEEKELNDKVNNKKSNLDNNKEPKNENEDNENDNKTQKEGEQGVQEKQVVQEGVEQEQKTKKEEEEKTRKEEGEEKRKIEEEEKRKKEEEEEEEEEIFQIEKIRNLFLSVFVGWFKKIARFMIIPKNEEEMSNLTLFDNKKFLMNAPEDCVPFLKEFLKSQMFISFIQEKILDNNTTFQYFFKQIHIKMEKRCLQYTSNQNPEIKGWLKKRNLHGLKKWKNRFFWLQNEKLYSSHKSLGSKNALLKRIPLVKGKTTVRIPVPKEILQMEMDKDKENENEKQNEREKEKEKEKEKKRHKKKKEKEKNKNDYKRFDLITYYKHKKKLDLLVERKFELSAPTKTIRKLWVQYLKSVCMSTEEVNFLGQFDSKLPKEKNELWETMRRKSGKRDVIDLNEVYQKKDEKIVNIGSVKMDFWTEQEESTKEDYSDFSSTENKKDTFKKSLNEQNRINTMKNEINTERGKEKEKEKERENEKEKEREREMKKEDEENGNGNEN
ncbi:c-myc promoter binding protein [Anaeramoeba flamelloides]|uniref:C-myc promoter binding protein n=1 Tax=Anaeramoeba flamelloides TaxID=1746091 RepID=A0AAV7Y9C0_9EUKA|nr:c-myc promoter binding protein [Anaeramoeba flamelloides]